MNLFRDEYGKAEADFLQFHSQARYPAELIRDQSQFLFESKFVQQLSTMDEYFIYRLLCWRRSRYISTSLQLSVFLNHWIEFKKISPFLSATFLSAARVRLKTFELKNLLESFSKLEKFGFARHPNLAGLEMILNRNNQIQNFSEADKIQWLFCAIEAQTKNPRTPYPDYWSYDEIWDLALQWEAETLVPLMIFKKFKTTDLTRCRVLQFYLQQNRLENLETMVTILMPSLSDCFVCPEVIRLGLQSDIPELVQAAAQRKIFFQNPELEKKRSLFYQNPEREITI
ncbi:MAG: hypothetical protein ACAH59_01085 [Pseudobdellovibrionaceae bacterium]